MLLSAYVELRPVDDGGALRYPGAIGSKRAATGAPAFADGTAPEPRKLGHLCRRRPGDRGGGGDYPALT
jgi:hypothetical protein